MINTASRNPVDTINALEDCLATASLQGVVPLRVECGLYQQRDIARACERDCCGPTVEDNIAAAKERPRYWRGLPLVVTQLEDGVRIRCEKRA
jgi:ribosomal protein S28E/S33